MKKKTTASFREKLIEDYRLVRKQTERICVPLLTEDYVPQPVVDVSPPKWHLGHTTWFFETFVLKKFVPAYRPFHPGFAYLFNSYYNNEGDRVLRHHRGDLSRPSVEEIYLYRAYVDNAIEAFILNEKNDQMERWSEVLVIGLNHEQQHQELLWTDIKYILSANPLFPVYSPESPFSGEKESGKPMGFITVDEGLYEIGFDGSGFCFDNELKRHKVYLHSYGIADRLVTNAEYIEFMESGGYDDFNLWHDEGWKWVRENRIEAPLYWYRHDGEWMQFTLSGLKPVVPGEVLKHISFYEAYAFAQWRGMRLPTEQEWEAASCLFEWGLRWEWTASPYTAYPGYEKAPGAIGEYNGKFMINQMVLRGASVATPKGHSRTTYRNFFHPHLRWQFTGIRLAK